MALAGNLWEPVWGLGHLFSTSPGLPTLCFPTVAPLSPSGHPEQVPYCRAEGFPPLSTPSGLYICPSKDGKNSFLPRGKKKSKHNMYFFRGLHVSGLTSVTYIVAMVFIRVAQRVSGEGRNGSLGFEPPEF